MTVAGTFTTCLAQGTNTHEFISFIIFYVIRFQGRHFNFFLGGPNFIFIFQCHRTIEKLEKTALYM